ncbi:M20 family metallopeptidase [Lichenifustis flavocetrariae]|uniref:M20 family metallopeptidase n=1 Tax=Lichenifustis flavocetrariae TaxID=2949735 RepID=A0AA42CIJ2_9HYPH|nr:M20 family metallopeptidase [Lichenifustis flavocetrariae]MCW6506931.1 M20 family metallopeptidase [Lichenifustis flavocetrariae]
MRNAEEIWDLVDAKREPFEVLADRVFDTPELNFTEHRSVAEHVDMLKAEGFQVTEAVAGMPTAVIGEAGQGGPLIAILGEYDALPGLSQEPGVAEHRPLPGRGYGHGCGHNLLGSASLLAATAVKDFLASHGLPGRVRYYGCPAEEGGSGKTYMVRAGAYDGVDAAICWHPSAFSGVNAAASLACMEADFTFLGRSAHAAAAPHLGRSALDAVELMNVGVNYMREHMPSSARIHYAILDTGGIAPNVVQARAVVRYLVRARDLDTMRELFDRVLKVAQGATLMTETSVSHRVLSADANLIGNGPLETVMGRVYERLGGPKFDAADRAFAAEIQKTLTDAEIVAAYQRAGQAPRPDTPLCDWVVDINDWSSDGVGSTDVGTVSWVTPTVQARGATYAIGTPGHSWQLTAQGKMPAAHKGMVHAAKVMAATAMDLFNNPEILDEAKIDHRRRVGDKPFVSPIPPDVDPPLDMAAH